VSRRREWLAGAVVGAWGGFLLVEGPVVGLALLAAFGAGAVTARSAAAAAGLLAATGGVILLMFLLVNLNCIGLYGGTGDECTPPDVTWWFGVGSLLTVIGVGLTGAAVASPR
jgi:hypothetical protein